MVSWQERLKAHERQIERLERLQKNLEARIRRYWEINLLIFVGGCIIVILALFLARWLGMLCVLAGLVAFGIVSYKRGKMDKSLVRHLSLRVQSGA